MALATVPYGNTRNIRPSTHGKAVKTALALCLAVFLAGCSVDLYDNLDQKQANEIVSVLFRHGIPSERIISKDGKYTVRVDDGRFAEAISILNDQGLPKQKFASLGEVFKNDGIVASPVQERAQMIFALSQELSRTISDIDGVLSARVHLVLPENDPLRQQLIPSSASVFIRHTSNTAVSNLTPQVKMLVANGVAGLSYEKVSVVLVPVDAPEPTSSARADQDFTSFLGLWMHRDSANRAAWIFFTMIALLIGAASAAGFLFLNQRKRIYPLSLPNRVKT